jgi:hypothetical protein
MIEKKKNNEEILSILFYFSYMSYAMCSFIKRYNLPIS